MNSSLVLPRTTLNYLSVFDLLLIPFILFGNILVLVTYKTTPRLQISANLLLVNLAWTDILAGVLAIPWKTLYLYRTLRHAPSEVLCRLGIVLYMIPICVSVCTVLLTALFRLTAVAWPSKYKVWFTFPKTRLYMIMVWILMTIQCVLQVALERGTWSKDKPCALYFIIPHGISASFILLLIISLITFVSYVLIAVILKKRRSRARSYSNSSFSRINTGMIDLAEEHADLTVDHVDLTDKHIDLAGQEGGGTASCGRQDVSVSQDVSKTHLNRQDTRHDKKHIEEIQDSHYKENGKDLTHKGDTDRANGTPSSTDDIFGTDDTNTEKSNEHDIKEENKKGVNAARPAMERLDSQQSRSGTFLKRRQNGEGPENRYRLASVTSGRNGTNREGKIVRMFVVIVACFYLCYSQALISMGLCITYRYTGRDLPQWLLLHGEIANSLIFVSSLINPIIYAGMNRTFRSAFRRLLHI